nr:hypothetical chloroplast RF19 [Dracaena serrulata]
MILKSFLLGNLLSLCMKIINSVVVVGLYYGFLTTFSIGPSYIFLLRARVMEEGTEKEVSATTGFITGQLMMFISIYYAPLHLALGRPHTITVLVLPYLLFHFFWNNHKNFFLLWIYYQKFNAKSQHSMCIPEKSNFSIIQPFHFTKFNVSQISQHLYVSMQQQDVICNKEFCWLVNWSHFIHEMGWLGIILDTAKLFDSIKKKVPCVRIEKFYGSNLKYSLIYHLCLLFRQNAVAYCHKETERNLRNGRKKRRKRCRNNLRRRQRKPRLRGFLSRYSSRKLGIGKTKLKKRREKRKKFFLVGKTYYNFSFRLETMESTVEIYKKGSIGKCYTEGNVTIFFLYMPKEWKTNNIFYISTKFINFFRNDRTKNFFVHDRKTIPRRLVKLLGSYQGTKKIQLEQGIDKENKNSRKREGISCFRYTRKKDQIMQRRERTRILVKKVRSFFEWTLSRKNKKIRFTCNHERFNNFQKGFRRNGLDKKDSKSLLKRFSRIRTSKEYVWLKREIFIEFDWKFLNLNRRIIFRTRATNRFRKSNKIFEIYIRCNFNGSKRSNNNEKEIYWNGRNQEKGFSLVIQIDRRFRRRGRRKGRRIDGRSRNSFKKRQTRSNLYRKRSEYKFQYKKKEYYKKCLYKKKKHKRRRRRSGFDTLLTTIGFSPGYNQRIHACSKTKNSYWGNVSSKCAFSTFSRSHRQNLFFFRFLISLKRLITFLGIGSGKTQNCKFLILRRKRQKKKSKQTKRKKKKTNEKQYQKLGIPLYLLKQKEVKCKKPNLFLENTLYYPYKKELKILAVCYYCNSPNGTRIGRNGIKKCMLNVPIMAFNYQKQNFPKIGKQTVFRKRFYFLSVGNLGEDLKYDLIIEIEIRNKGKRRKKTIFVFKQSGEGKQNYLSGLPENDLLFLNPFLTNSKKKRKKQKGNFFKLKGFSKKEEKIFKKFQKKKQEKFELETEEGKNLKKEIPFSYGNGEREKYMNRMKTKKIPIEIIRLSENRPFECDPRIVEMKIIHSEKQKGKILLIRQEQLGLKEKESQKTRKKEFELVMIKDRNQRRIFCKCSKEKISEKYVNHIILGNPSLKKNAWIYYYVSLRFQGSMHNFSLNQQKKLSTNPFPTLKQIKKELRKQIKIQGTLFRLKKICFLIFLILTLVIKILGIIIVTYLLCLKPMYFTNYHKINYLTSIIGNLYFNITTPILFLGIRSRIIVRHEEYLIPNQDKKKIHKSGMNKWKNWLKGHYQYNLSQTKWDHLVPKKWRNRVNQCRMIQKKDSMKLDLYKKEKDQLIHYMKKKLLCSELINKSKRKSEKTLWIKSFVIKTYKLCEEEGLVYFWINITSRGQKNSIKFQYKYTEIRIILKIYKYIYEGLSRKRIYYGYGQKYGEKIFGLENSSFLSEKEYRYGDLGQYAYRHQDSEKRENGNKKFSKIGKKGSFFFYDSSQNQPIQSKKSFFGLDRNESRKVISYHIKIKFRTLVFPRICTTFGYVENEPVDHTNQITYFEFSFLGKKYKEKRKDPRKKKKKIFLYELIKKNILNEKIPTKKKTNNKVKEILYQIYENKTKRKILKKITREQILKKAERKNNSRARKKRNWISSGKNIFFFNKDGMIPRIKERSIISRYIVSYLDRYTQGRKLLYPQFKEERCIWMKCGFRKTKLLQNGKKEEYLLSNPFVYLGKRMENLLYIKPEVFHWLIRISAKLMENAEEKVDMLKKRILMDPLHNTAICLGIEAEIILISLFPKIFYLPDVVENLEFKFVSISGIGMLGIKIHYFAIKTTKKTGDNFKTGKSILIQMQINSLNKNRFFGPIIDKKIKLVRIVIGLIPITVVISVCQEYICIHDSELVNSIFPIYL